MGTQPIPFSPEQKNELLRDLLQQLSTRGIARRWAALKDPRTALVLEFQELRSDLSFMKSLASYLDENPIIIQTVETLLAQLAMAANSKWQETPVVVQPLSRRGWHISRWLPTFLIIDGPLGRVFSAGASPLNQCLKQEHSRFPVLCETRDAFNHELFRLVRNGIGHWAFVWKDQDGAPQIDMVDWSTGRVTASISLLEAEALHFLAFSVIESLDNELFKSAIRNRAT